MKQYNELNWWSSSYFPQINLVVIEIDSRVVIAFLPFGFYMSEITLWFAMLSVGLFGILGYLGYSVPVSIKKARTFYAGKQRFVSTNKRRRRNFNHG